MTHRIRYVEVVVLIMLSLATCQSSSGLELDQELVSAAAKGDVGRVQELLARGGNVNFSSQFGRTPLLEACEKGRLETVSLLIARRADTNAEDGDGARPLDLACRGGFGEIIQILLQNGANIRPLAKQHHTIHLGDWFCCSEITKGFLKLGIDINSQFPEVLHFASFVGQVDMVELLLTHGGNVNVRDGIGFRDYMKIADKPRTGYDSAYDLGCSSWICRLGTEQVCKAWTFKGADVLTTLATPLHWASLGDQPAVVKMLIDKGADIRAVDIEGHTALHVASAGHNPKVVRILLDSGAEVNAKDSAGTTPLGWALRTNIPRAMENDSVEVCKVCYGDLRRFQFGSQAVKLFKAYGAHE